MVNENIDIARCIEKIGTKIYDFSAYLNRYKNFYNNMFPTLVDYWSGRGVVVDPNIIVEFEYLYDEYYNMIYSFQSISIGNQVDLDYFDFCEFLNEIKVQLDYMKNLPKYLKTSINYIDVFEEPVIEYLVRQGDTLESIAQKFYGDPENFSILMDYNRIKYYDVNNLAWVGRKLKIPARRIITRDVNGVIDGLVGQNVLGKDIDNDFHFNTTPDANGNYDIASLQYEDCFENAITYILEQTPKGSVPEYPYLGSNTAQIVGQDFGELSFSMIINDLSVTLKNEPTLDKLNITDIKLDSDALKIDFTMKSVLGTTFDYQYIND